MRDLPSARLKASLFVVPAVAGSNPVCHLQPVDDFWRVIGA